MALVIANFLSEVLDECRRLKAATEFFPSRSKRKVLLVMVQTLSSVMESMDYVLRKPLFIKTILEKRYSTFLGQSTCSLMKASLHCEPLIYVHRCFYFIRCPASCVRIAGHE